MIIKSERILLFADEKQKAAQIGEYCQNSKTLGDIERHIKNLSTLRDQVIKHVESTAKGEQSHDPEKI